MKTHGNLALKQSNTTTQGAAFVDAAEAAEAYRNAALTLDEAKAALAVARVDLLERVDAAREDLVRSGVAVTTLEIRTLAGGATVKVVYRESYHGISPCNAPALREAFGDRYSLYVEERAEPSIRKGTTLAALRAAIGEEALRALEPLVALKVDVVCRRGVPAQIARLYGEGDATEAGDLAAFHSACANAPQVRAK